MVGFNAFLAPFHFMNTSQINKHSLQIPSSDLTLTQAQMIYYIFYSIPTHVTDIDQLAPLHRIVEP